MTIDDFTPDESITKAFEAFVVDRVQRGATYMDAISTYMEQHGIEPEDSKRLVMSSKPVYQNLMAECQDNGLLKHANTVA